MDILKKKCIICDNEYLKKINESKNNWEKRKVCCRECYYKHKSISMKGKMPKNIKLIAGALKGKGAFNTCKGCGIQFQSRPELKHVKTKYCTRDCWLANNKNKFQERPNAKRGENHHYWKGGVNTIRSAERNTLEYKKWRHDVFERDDHKCVNCGSTEDLRADHIKPVSKHPELIHDINNGRVLCKACDYKIGYQYFKDDNPKKELTCHKVL